MTKTTITALLALSAGAHAALIPAEMVTLDEASRVEVEFVSSSAGAGGNLYFLGHDLGGGLLPAVSSDVHDLGRFLFNNHSSDRGERVDLGVLPGGATLHFAYLIVRGVRVAPTGSLFRTDVADDEMYFASEVMPDRDGAGVTRFSIEDIRDPRTSDWDYNDAVFSIAVTPTPVPTPGAAAVGALALGLMARRRRG
jgi:uncharacterized protein (TIGR03382 family)